MLNIDPDIANVCEKSLHSDWPDFTVGGWNDSNALELYIIEQCSFHLWLSNAADQPNNKLGCIGVQGTDKQKHVISGICFKIKLKIAALRVSEHGISKYKAIFLVWFYRLF